MIKKVIYSILTTLAVVSVFQLAQPVPAYAQEVDNDSCGQNRFLTFPTWYRGLPQESGAGCGVAIFAGSDGISRTIWTIGLNVVEIIIQLVAYLSVAYIMIGGYRYLLSNGSPDGNIRGRKTIMNAVVGLILSLASVAIVNTVVNNI